MSILSELFNHVYFHHRYLDLLLMRQSENPPGDINSIHSLTPTLLRRLSIALAAMDDVGSRKGRKRAKKKDKMDPKDCSVSEDVWKLVDRLSENIIHGLTKLIQPHTKVLAEAVKPNKTSKVSVDEWYANKEATRELLTALSAISTLAVSKSFSQAITNNQQMMTTKAKSDSLLYCILHAYSLMCTLQQQEVEFRTMARLCQSSRDGMLSAFVHLSLVLDGDGGMCDHGALRACLAEILGTMCSGVYKALNIEDLFTLFKAPVAAGTRDDGNTTNSTAAAVFATARPPAAIAPNINGSFAASMKLKEQFWPWRPVTASGMMSSGGDEQ